MKSILYDSVFHAMIGTLSLSLTACSNVVEKKPNIVLIMADDLGYCELGYTGNNYVKTPNLDQMAAEGVQLTHFYAAAPVSSPTRASCLTGRHPYRSGITWAGRHALPTEETTLAEVLKENGYATAHFGKWHLGGLSKKLNQSHFKGGPSPYSPPWEHGFEVCFTSESMMPLYNPYYHVGGDYGSKKYREIQTEPISEGQQTGGNSWKNYYWTGHGTFIDEDLKGTADQILVDKAIDFIRNNKSSQPFFVVLWLHTPHTPIVAGDSYRNRYSELDIRAQHYYGAISAMDEQIGRFRSFLRTDGVADNTIVWFKSDNGASYVHNFDEDCILRGKKGDLYEGGVRVPSIIEWPDMLKDHKIIKEPVSTSDIFPTILSMANISYKSKVNIDGENIFPIISKNKKRIKPIGFLSPIIDRKNPHNTSVNEQMALVNGDYKIISVDNGRTFQLYNLLNDISETTDLSALYPDITSTMKNKLSLWIEDVKTEQRNNSRVK
jgi:arylsulfatase A-like enzyme